MKGNRGVTAAYLAVCIIWGSTYLAMRIAVSSFPPELFAGMRFFIAGAMVLAYAVIRKKAFPNTIKDVFKAAVPGILMLMGSNGLIMWAEQWVHSGITSLLLAATPLFVAVIEVLIFRDGKMGRLGWGCLLTGFLGTGMLIVTGAGVGSIDLVGGMIVLAASILWSIGSIYSKKVSYSGDIASHIGIQMLAAGVGLALVGTLSGELSRVHFSMEGILALAYLVIFGSIIGYSSNMYVLSKWPASKAITSAYVNPIVAVILGVVLLNEDINFLMVMFMVLTLGSVVLLHLIKYGVIQNKKRQ